LPVAQQQATLALLAELLKNPWFKHFIAVWAVERDKARAAVCDFPLMDYRTTVTALQCRGEAVAYHEVVKLPYDTYNKLVEDIKEQERIRDERGTDSRSDRSGELGGITTGDLG
jgi:hypothetical protein